MIFIQDVLKKLDDGETVYIYDEYEEAVFKFLPTTPREVYIRRSRSREMKIGWDSDIAYEARLGGEIITKEEYVKY